MTFIVQHEKTRIFACQNPASQGGNRKGLPKSFLNRFTSVWQRVDWMCEIKPDVLISGRCLWKKWVKQITCLYFRVHSRTLSNQSCRR